jgi:hypothetical protein
MVVIGQLLQTICISVVDLFLVLNRTQWVLFIFDESKFVLNQLCTQKHQSYYYENLLGSSL